MERKPAWLKVSYNQGAVDEIAQLMRELNLNTVCREADCPNIGECYRKHTATFMILGSRCTRNCRFCNVRCGAPAEVDPEEPANVARAAKALRLRHAVVTSVTRDDLPDGGAAHWAQTIEAVHAAVPGVLVEVLVPDFNGDPAAVDTVIRARPEVFGHNLETVPRLYPQARPQADYARSLAVLRQASAAGMITKTSVMLGLGETAAELEQTLRDARAAGCSIFYAGQYLQPTPRHLPVARYVEPAEFDRLRAAALSLGFEFVASAPLVRSSYHEDGQSEFVRSRTREGGVRN